MEWPFRSFSLRSRIARATVEPVPDQAADPGADSGLHLRQGLKPASSAAAAELTKLQFINFGLVAGQMGRQ